MSALCAFPPLIPAAGAVYSAGYMADVSASSGRIGPFAAFANSSASSSSSSQQHQPHQQQGQSRLVPAYGSTFTAFHHPAGGVTSAKMMTKIAQPESAWSSRSAASLTNPAVDVPPAAKRRCTDKARSGNPSTGWVEQQAQSLWPSSSAATCPSGCVMCHIQQQQQQVYGHQQTGGGFVPSTQFDARRPLQEKHQNREDLALLQNNNNNNSNSNNNNVNTLSHSLKPPSKPTGGRPLSMTGNRALAVDPKKDYSTPLHVDCSVEYDLPRIVRPPPGAQPLLILAPPRHPTSVAAPSSVYQSSSSSSSSWTSCRPLPPQWTHGSSASRAKAGDKPPQPSVAPVKSHAVAQQQQQQQAVTKLNASGGVRKANGGLPCGCPTCCLRPGPSAVPPVNVYGGLGGGAGWMNQHWSPPAGATASSAGFGYAQPQQQQQQQQAPQQQQQQQPQAGYQMASFHAINQEQQQQQQQQTAVNGRRRKRSPEAPPAASDKMQRLYSTAQWMPDPSIQAAFLAVAASQRYVGSSPAAWSIASAPQPIKFHC